MLNFVDQRIGPRSFPPVFVEGSRLVAKVESITTYIEHVQSISRSQRSTGTLGFYADHDAAEATKRSVAVAVFTYTHYKSWHAKTNTTIFKSYK